MIIDIICVGNLKEKYWKAAVNEYVTRLSVYCNINITEVKEAKLVSKGRPSEDKIVLDKEGKAIIEKIKDRNYVIALDINGESISSEGLADKFKILALSGKSSLTFIIGGSLGLSNEVLKRADMRLSFSKMTFPHQMMRVILLEQIYRAFKINRNETYHK